MVYLMQNVAPYSPSSLNIETTVNPLPPPPPPSPEEDQSIWSKRWQSSNAVVIKLVIGEPTLFFI